MRRAWSTWLLGVVVVAPAAGGSRELEIDPGALGVDLLAAAAGSRALLVAREEGLEIVSFSTGAVGARLERGDARVFAWCVAADAGAEERVFILRDRGEIVAWRGGEEAPEVVLTDRAANLPSGVTHLPFVRDLDGDGRVDVVVPTAEGLNLWRSTGDGFVKTASVRHDVDVSLSADGPEADDPELEQRVRIPRFDVEDMNGDGTPDLVFSDDEHVQFFWSRPDGSLPEEPTFTLDLDEIRAALPKRSRDLIDTTNLLKLLESAVSHLSRDFDGDGFADLMLRRGRKVSLYRGGEGGVDRSKAAQVLRTGGNLLTAAAFDDDGDGRDDLALLLMSDVSIGQLLLWLVAGGDLELDLYVYRQEGPLRFARKPSRRRTLTIDLPSAASLMTEFEDQVDGIADELARLPVAGDFDGDGAVDDVARRMPDGAVGVYRDAAPEGAEAWSKDRAWRSVVRKFDRAAEGGDRFEDDLVSLIDWAPLPGRDLVLAIDARAPDRTHPIADDEGATIVLFALDVDGEPGDELVVVKGSGETAPLGLEIVSRALE